MTNFKLNVGKQKEAINSYQSSLCEEIDAGSLLARNSAAHKWKVTYRTILLRELASWRFCDLMNQALIFEEQELYLGSRTLIRSAIETLSIIIYCSEKMETIVHTGNGFHSFGLKTSRLLLGSKRENTKHSAINVLETLRKASKQHPELLLAYDDLSETTHPNFDGLFRMYAKTSDEGMVTHFKNRSSELYKSKQNDLITLLLAIFEIEYNDRWGKAFDSFEIWIEENDAFLERTK